MNNSESEFVFSTQPFRMEVLNISVSGQNYGVLVKTKVFVSKKQNHIFGQIVGVAQT